MNRCDCPSPPGGSVTCEPNQLAICDVEHGGRCCTPPKSVRINTQEFDNWALSIITDMKRDPGQVVTDDDRRVLRSGRYRHLNGTDVLFSMPRATDTGSSFSASA